MRTIIILILGLMVMASRALADEKLPVLKVGSDTYSNVTVTEITATDIYFISDKGLANAKLKKLDPVLQKHFHYNPAAAAAAEQKQKLGNAQYRFRVNSANQPSSMADVKAEMDDAISQVQEIVNQPVRSLPRTPDMRVACPVRVGYIPEPKNLTSTRWMSALPSSLFTIGTSTSRRT